MKNQGFVLIEMILSMVILSVGIVAVLSSFLSVASALDKVQIQLEAVYFFEKNFNALQEKNIQTDLLEENQRGVVDIARRRFNWETKIEPETMENELDIWRAYSKIYWMDGQVNQEICAEASMFLYSEN